MKKGKRSSRGSGNVVDVAGEEPAHTIIHPRVVLNLAAPGAGKGTIMRLAQDVLPNMRVLVTSSLLAKRYQDGCRKDGGLAPDSAVNELLEDSLGGLKLFTRINIRGKLVRANAPTMLFIDGWPRSEEQARFVTKTFGASDLINETLVLDWQLPDSLSLQRQSCRWAQELALEPGARRHDFIEDSHKAAAQHRRRLDIFKQNAGDVRNVLQRAGFRIETLNANQKPTAVLRDFLRATQWATLDELTQRESPTLREGAPAVTSAVVAA